MKKIFNSIVIFCALGCLVSLNAQTYDVVWTDLVGVTANGNTISKTSVNGWGNGGAASTNLLEAGEDGWIEVTVLETNKRRMLGLNTSSNSSHYNEIDFTIYFKHTENDIRIYENGINLGDFTTYSTGDVFRIERTGNQIHYKKNGVTFYTSANASTTSLIIDSSIFETGGTLNNAQASFDDPANSVPTCSDGIQNGDETGVDCGGSCPPCSTGGGTGGGFFVNDDGPNDVDIRYSDGKVVIGDSLLAKPGDYRLYVGGGVLTEKVKVAIESTADWADYVFEKNHNLVTLQEVEKSIIENKHLPNVPSADKMVENGLDVAKMDATLLRQIEELWLHTIELKKENEALKKRLEALENKK